LIKIDNILVDLAAVRSIAHHCDPARCKGSRSCCARYEVSVTESELSALIGMLPAAARFARHLRDGEDFIDVFEEADDGALVLATDEEMRCVFAFRDRAGRTLCSLHAAAIETGLDPAAHKPRSCWLWPLALSDRRPLALSVSPGAFAFPCNRRRRGRPAFLHAGIREIILGAFGERFGRELDTAIGSRTTPAARRRRPGPPSGRRRP